MCIRDRCAAISRSSSRSSLRRFRKYQIRRRARANMRCGSGSIEEERDRPGNATVVGDEQIELLASAWREAVLAHFAARLGGRPVRLHPAVEQQLLQGRVESVSYTHLT